MSRIITSDDMVIIRARHEAGEQTTVIAWDFGVVRNTLADHLHGRTPTPDPTYILTTEDRAEVVARIKAGEFAYVLAREYDVSRCAIGRAWVDLTGQPMPSKLPRDGKPRVASRLKRPTWCDPATAAEVRRLHARGVGLTGIAALLKLPYRTIHEVIHHG